MPIEKHDAAEYDMHFITAIGDCDRREHQVSFGYDPSDEPEWMQLFVSPHLTTFRSPLRRIWVAIRYVLGFRSFYGEWDEVVLNRTDVIVLWRFIGNYLQVSTQDEGGDVLCRIDRAPKCRSRGTRIR